MTSRDTQSSKETICTPCDPTLNTKMLPNEEKHYLKWLEILPPLLATAFRWKVLFFQLGYNESENCFKCPIGSTRECEVYKVCNFFVSMFFLVFFKIDFFKTKIFICFNSPGLFVHLLCLSLVQEDFRTGFIFIVALTKKKCLPLKLFLRQIGPNWGSGLSKTIVCGQVSSEEA